MKKISFLTILLSTFCYLNSYADEVYSRGYVIAVDTRVKSACEIVKQKIAGIATAGVQGLCNKDNSKPYAVIVATLPMDEFEFSAQEELLQDNLMEISADSNSSRGAIYILPKHKEFDHYLHFTSHRNQAAISYTRQQNFANMAEATKQSLLIVPFIIKSDSADSKASSSASQNDDFLKSQTDIIDVIKDVFTGHSNRRIMLQFFSPDELVCETDPLLCHTTTISVGLNLVIKF